MVFSLDIRLLSGHETDLDLPATQPFAGASESHRLLTFHEMNAGRLTHHILVIMPIMAQFVYFLPHFSIIPIPVHQFRRFCRHVSILLHCVLERGRDTAGERLLLHWTVWFWIAHGWLRF